MSTPSEISPEEKKLSSVMPTTFAIVKAEIVKRVKEACCQEVTEEEARWKEVSWGGPLPYGLLDLIREKIRKVTLK